jgi:hypothetical protein
MANAPAIQVFENKEFEMEFKANYNMYQNRVLALEKNKTKASICICWKGDANL